MPAVFVHGVPDTARVWHALIARLGRKDVVTVSLPGFGQPVALPPGTVLAQPDDVVSMYSLRGGLGFHVTERADVYFDAIGLRMSTRNAGAHSLGRFALGAQYFMGNGWFLNGGIGVDTLGKVNVSGGLAYRPAPSIEAQLALQSNAAPEVKPEVGNTPLIAGSLAWVF